MAIPKYDELFNPVLRALHALGGSATNQELEDKVIELRTEWSQAI
jgi:restriction system protein